MLRAIRTVVVLAVLFWLMSFGVLDGVTSANTSQDTNTSTRTIAVFAGRVSRSAKNQLGWTLPDGFKMHIFWITPHGISRVPLNRNQFIPIDGWTGKFNSTPFRIGLYRSTTPWIVNSKGITYAVGVNVGGKRLAGLAFHSPVRWVAFTKQYVVFAARMAKDGSPLGSWNFYAIDLKRGITVSNQVEVRQIYPYSTLPGFVAGITQREAGNPPTND